jgi:hypothetical protein
VSSMVVLRERPPSPLFHCMRPRSFCSQTTFGKTGFQKLQLSGRDCSVNVKCWLHTLATRTGHALHVCQEQAGMLLTVLRGYRIVVDLSPKAQQHHCNQGNNSGFKSFVSVEHDQD